MDAVEFGTLLTSSATGALAYIGAGVAAGGVIFAVTLGVRKGISALRTVGK